MGDTLREIYVSGVRADDMALRFAYAGFPTNRIHVVKDYKALCERVHVAQAAGLHDADVHGHAGPPPDHQQSIRL